MSFLLEHKRRSLENMFQVFYPYNNIGEQIKKVFCGSIHFWVKYPFKPTIYQFSSPNLAKHSSAGSRAPNLLLNVFSPVRVWVPPGATRKLTR